MTYVFTTDNFLSIDSAWTRRWGGTKGESWMKDQRCQVSAGYEWLRLEIDSEISARRQQNLNKLRFEKFASRKHRTRKNRWKSRNIRRSIDNRLKNSRKEQGISSARSTIRAELVIRGSWKFRRTNRTTWRYFEIARYMSLIERLPAASSAQTANRFRGRWRVSPPPTIRNSGENEAPRPIPPRVANFAGWGRRGG